MLSTHDFLSMIEAQADPRVHQPFISKFVRSSACRLNQANDNKETPMRALIRPFATALTIATLAAALAAFSTSGAQAQAQGGSPPPLKQIALTDKQVTGAIAAQKEMNPITAKMQENAKPDPKVMTQLEGIAKKNGFASYDEFGSVMDNIGLVLGGIDPATKKYVGSEAVIKSEIAQVEADKKMSAADKKQALEDLNAALKVPEPAVQNKGNIDLVSKYYDQLEAVMGEDQR
jgi:hypothetical protein